MGSFHFTRMLEHPVKKSIGEKEKQVKKGGKRVMDKIKFLLGYLTGVVIVLILRRDKWLPLLEELLQHQ